MTTPYDEGVIQLHTAIRKSIAEHNDDKSFQDYVTAGAIILELKRLKMQKLNAIQYNFNLGYERYITKIINDPKTKTLPEEEKKLAKWPIEFFPDQRKKENLKKGITHIHFLLGLIQNWWHETDYYEHIEQAGQIFDLNINQVYFLIKKYLTKKQTVKWNNDSLEEKISKDTR